MTWTDLLGYAAASAVLASFCMSAMLHLRLLALTSNLLFASYGLADHLYPVLILHMLLFPVNLVRLLQAWRLRRQTATAIPIAGSTVSRSCRLLNPELETQMRYQRYKELRNWSKEDRAEFAKWSRGVIVVCGTMVAALVLGLGAYQWSAGAAQRETAAVDAATKTAFTSASER
jgi:hypothetical protein